MNRLIQLALIAIVAFSAPAFAGDESKEKMKELNGEIRKLQKEIGKLKPKYVKDEAIMELKKAADAARKAYEDALLEKVAADADGAKLVEEFKAKTAEMDTLREEMKKAQAEKAKAAKEAKDKKAKEGGEKKAKKNKGGEEGGEGGEE